jgi:hypothetical protein
MRSFGALVAIAIVAAGPLDLNQRASTANVIAALDQYERTGEIGALRFNNADDFVNALKAVSVS